MDAGYPLPPSAERPVNPLPNRLPPLVRDIYSIGKIICACSFQPSAFLYAFTDSFGTKIFDSFVKYNEMLLSREETVFSTGGVADKKYKH